MKLHLLDSAEPLTEGRDYTALCGADVHKARFALVWDIDVIGHADLSLGVCCRKCLEFEFDHRYLYGLLSGEEFEQMRS